MQRLGHPFSKKKSTFVVCCSYAEAGTTLFEKKRYLYSMCANKLCSRCADVPWMMVLDLGNVLCGNELCNMCEMLDSDNETMYYVSRWVLMMH
jgi:hypothetical protein